MLYVCLHKSCKQYNSGEKLYCLKCFKEGKHNHFPQRKYTTLDKEWMEYFEGLGGQVSSEGNLILKNVSSFLNLLSEAHLEGVDEAGLAKIRAYKAVIIKFQQQQK